MRKRIPLMRSHILGGAYCGKMPPQPYIVIDINFENVVAETKGELAQLNSVEEQIVNFTNSDEFTRKIRKAFLSRGTDGIDRHLDPVTLEGLETQYADLVFGSITPEYAEVSPNTFYQICQILYPKAVKYSFAPRDWQIGFNEAAIKVNLEVPIGYIRWFYGKNV